MAKIKYNIYYRDKGDEYEIKENWNSFNDNVIS